MQFMPLFVAPQILLGGIFLPREDMPEVLYQISNWLPLSHSIEALNLVTTGGDIGDILWELAIVLAFALGAVVLAALTLRRRSR